MRRLFVFLLMSAVGGLGLLSDSNPTASAQPKEKPKPEIKTITLKDGTKVKVGPRDQLRMNIPTARGFRRPAGAGARAFGAFAEPAPAAFDWTKDAKGNKIEFPMLGNDTFLDCFYTASAHLVQTWTGTRGKVTVFKENELVARYKVISEGDNGLFPDQMLGEFQNEGIVGPRGPFKILDFLTINPTDDEAIAQAVWLYGGVFYTCSLLDTWQANMQPNATFTNDGRPDPAAGHAMIINGKNNDGTYKLQTYGIDPPIRLTQAGLESAKPELTVCFSLDWFDKTTGKAPNGKTYQELAKLWLDHGGHANLVPRDPPFKVDPKEDAIQPKVEVSGKSVTVTIGTDVFIIDTDKKTVTLQPGWNGIPGIGGNVADELKTAGVKADTITAVVQLLSNLKNKKGDKTATEDLLRALRSIDFPPK